MQWKCWSAWCGGVHRFSRASAVAVPAPSHGSMTGAAWFWCVYCLVLCVRVSCGGAACRRAVVSSCLRHGVVCVPLPVRVPVRVPVPVPVRVRVRVPTQVLAFVGGVGFAVWWVKFRTPVDAAPSYGLGTNQYNAL